MPCRSDACGWCKGDLGAIKPGERPVMSQSFYNNSRPFNSLFRDKKVHSAGFVKAGSICALFRLWLAFPALSRCGVASSGRATIYGVCGLPVRARTASRGSTVPREIAASSEGSRAE